MFGGIRDVPNVMVTFHCQGRESNGPRLDTERRELQELLEIDGEICVCHDDDDGMGGSRRNHRGVKDGKRMFWPGERDV